MFFFYSHTEIQKIGGISPKFKTILLQKEKNDRQGNIPFCLRWFGLLSHKIEAKVRGIFPCFKQYFFLQKQRNTKELTLTLTLKNHFITKREK